MTAPPVAVTGMHRSGTSMITRGLHESGLGLLGEDDLLIAAADDNPEGFWENKRMVAVNDDLLEATGGAWDTPPRLGPQGADDPRVAHLAGAATEALAGLRAQAHWGFKDPRTCLTASYWLDLEPELRFVVCVRHPVEVALSLRRRNQNSYALGLSLWHQYYEAVLAAVPSERRIVTHYDTWFDDPAGELARVCEFVGLTPSTATVRADLRHHDVSVSLAEAGVGDDLVALYRSLCTEAGVPVAPPRPVDEPRVRRLVLDGAVAQRHAEQRQEAIERLEEREAELRGQVDRLHREKAALETDLRNQLRRAEAQVAEARRAASDIERLREAVRAELAPLAAATAHAQQGIDRIAETTAATAARVEVAVANTRPHAGRRAVRRLGRVGYRGGRRFLFRPVRITVQRGRRRALPAAKRVARRLPVPAQRTLRRGRRLAHRIRRRVTGAPPNPHAPAAAGDGAPSPRAVDRSWVDRFTELVADVGPGVETVVVDVDGVVDAAVGPVLAIDSTTPALALIARVERARAAGAGHLAITEGSRRWLDAHPEARRHVATEFATLVDEPRAGMIFDLHRRPPTSQRSLLDEMNRLLGDREDQASVLDWTALGLAAQLPGLTVFTPRDPDQATLPYLDGSIDVVVIGRDGDRREAARVATTGVVTVEPGAAGLAEIHSIEAQGEPTASTVPRVVVLDDSVEAVSTVDTSAADVVVVKDPDLQPLPDAINRVAAAALATGDPTTGKVVAGDGTLESAGGTVFFDRSVGLIGHGTDDVTGPWHDYRRPVCWAPGLLAVPATVWDTVPRPAHAEGTAFFREWCAAAWASGHRVVYDPTVVVLRVSGTGGEPAAPVHETAWQRVLDLRPTRPTELADGAWRYLLATDDVDACRGDPST